MFQGHGALVRGVGCGLAVLVVLTGPVEGANERLYNGDWNPIWDVAVGRFDGGWTLETAVPFKSLRYRRGSDQLWGFNVRRVNVWKNELSFLVGIPNALGASGILQFSRAATVVGLEVPPRATNLDVKPFAITDLTSDRAATPPVSNALGGDVGLDVKYGVTQNLVADVTVNTDFAQVEADDQQVNLTRFSLFFPRNENSSWRIRGSLRLGVRAPAPLVAVPRRPSCSTAAESVCTRGKRCPSRWVAGSLAGRASSVVFV